MKKVVLNHKFFLTILIILWNISEFIGATERYNSNQFSAYVQNQLGYLENPTAGFLGLMPEIDTAFTIMFSFLIILVYILTLNILNSRRMPSIARYFTIILWVIGTVIVTKTVFINNVNFRMEVLSFINPQYSNTRYINSNSK